MALKSRDPAASAGRVRLWWGVRAGASPLARREPLGTRRAPSHVTPRADRVSASSYLPSVWGSEILNKSPEGVR